MTMCPAATKLSNILQFVKASYCEGEIDTERRRSHWPLCPSYLPSFPSTPILGVKSSDPKLTVNWLVMVAKPADINQSDFPPRLSEEAFFSLFCPGLSSDPVVILFLKLKKLDYGQMYVSEIHRHILDCIRRRKRKHIISISPQQWMQDVMIVVFFFFSKWGS